MSRRRRRVAPVELPRHRVAELPDGRSLTVGDEFSVTGEGRFRFAYVWEPDGSIAGFGPVGSNRAQWRSFSPDRVRTVHRKKTESRT